MTRIDKKKQRGFTIIELLLAMSIISFIMVFTMTVISQLITTYNRGLSLVQINQALRDFNNDLAKSLKYIGSSNVRYTFFKQDGETTTNADDTGIVAGALCAKDSTYIWNITDPPGQFFTYNDSNTPLRLVRINSNDNRYCNGAVRALPRNDQALDMVNLLGSQSTVLYASIGVVSPNGELTQKLLKVHFILSSAGADYRPVQQDGHWVCADTTKSEFCSFGEFNSIIYLRGA